MDIDRPPQNQSPRPASRPGMVFLVLLAGLLLFVSRWQDQVLERELCRLQALGDLTVQLERIRSLTRQPGSKAPEDEVHQALQLYEALPPEDRQALAFPALEPNPSSRQIELDCARMAFRAGLIMQDLSAASRQRAALASQGESLLLMLLILGLVYQTLRVRDPRKAVLERQLDLLEDAGRDLLRRFHEVDRSHRQLKADLSAAGRVQRALLPQQAPRIRAVEVGWMFTASSHVAGDMFNVFALDDHHLAVWVLDVSGHGVPAALLSVSVSRVLHPNPRQGGLLRRPRLGGGFELVAPAAVAGELNRRFPQAHTAGLYFTLLYGILDSRTGTFSYVRCGHPPPLLLSRKEARAQVVESEGSFPLGIFEDTVFRDELVRLDPGDRLILYTDGITECSTEEGADFGEQRLLGCLSRNAALDAASLMERLKTELTEFLEESRQRDDQTAVCLAWSPP